MFGLVVTASILLVGVLLVVYGTVVRNRWGITLQPVNCPCFQAIVPQVRKPESVREALWGRRNMRQVWLPDRQVGSSDHDAQSVTVATSPSHLKGD